MRRTARAPRPCFNEAAGFTQRKPVAAVSTCADRDRASMRPPVLPSGNPSMDRAGRTARLGGFNEAAGFTQRKPRTAGTASSGNVYCFNEAAGFTQRKH